MLKPNPLGPLEKRVWIEKPLSSPGSSVNPGTEKEQWRDGYRKEQEGQRNTEREAYNREGERQRGFVQLEVKEEIKVTMKRLREQQRERETERGCTLCV